MTCKVLTKSIVTMVTCLTLSSCFWQEETWQEEPYEFQGEKIELGEKLKNPFSVENMKIAYANITQRNAVARAMNTVEVRPTHWYVRFLPSDYSQYDLLIKDTTLALQDHPVDYAISKPGDFYHDPAVPFGKPTYQYTTVPVEYTVPNGIAFEILEELYLPESDVLLQNTTGRTAEEVESFVQALEDEAFLITGHLEDEPSEEFSSLRRPSKWVPAGSVAVFDNRLNTYIPLEGVKVQARRWFTVKTAYTDASGHFKMSSGFRHQASYRITWERDGFDIRSGTFGQALFNGPKKRGDWNLKIERNGLSFHYAHVFRAAMRYYYGDIGGLERPAFRLKYSVFDKRGNHMAKNIGNWSVFGINPNILIYRYSSLDGSENDADEMFSTTCHETAHTTHMQVMRTGLIQYAQVSETIRESWAIGVEWFITQKEYKERGITNYADASYKVNATFPTLYGFQYWNKSRNKVMTSLFIDLVDNNNQKGQSFGSFRTGTVSDPVYGYALSQIESGFLKDVYGLSSLHDKLKSRKPVETSDAQIDVLLKNF